MWKRFRQWQLRRRSITQPARTFEALLERAAQHRGAKEQALVRPKYLPKHPGRAIMRVAFAVMGGAFLYGAIAAVVASSNWGFPWYLTILCAPIAVITMWRAGVKLASSLDEDHPSTDRSDINFLTVLRILFWPISETGFLLIGWLGVYGYYGVTLIETWIKNWGTGHETSPSASQERTNTVAVLPDVLLGIIDAERDALIGPNSELEQLHARSLKVIEEARTVRAHFAQRTRFAGQRDSSPHLVAALKRADAVVMSIESRERELNERLRYIRTFYGECRARADALRDDVQDLVLFERLQNVERATEAIGDEMTAAIERVSVGILSSVERYRSLLSDAITETGVRTAVAGMDHRQAELDFETFDDTIARFVKRADTVLSDERQDTSDDAVHSEAHAVGLLTA